jgi:galactose mutarotase-like enzyme
LYRIEEEKLSVTYKVANTGYKPMYFSIGGHPAFKLPLTNNLAYTDYRLVFDQTENTGRWPISKDGLIELTSIPLFDNTNTLALSKELFYTDAIVLKHLRSTHVKLLSDKSPHGFEFDFTGFPYLGIWAAKHADFVCVEPWCGIADSVNSNQQLVNKEGINELAAQSHFERTWSITVF